MTNTWHKLDPTKAPYRAEWGAYVHGIALLQLAEQEHQCYAAGTWKPVPGGAHKSTCIAIFGHGSTTFHEAFTNPETGQVSPAVSQDEGRAAAERWAEGSGRIDASQVVSKHEFNAWILKEK